MNLTPEQIEEIQKIIEETHTDYVLNVWDSASRNAFLYGKLMALSTDPDTASMSYEEFKDYVKEQGIPLTEPEKLAQRFAAQSGARFVTSLGDKIQTAVTQEAIRLATASNINKRESLQKLRSDLGWMKQDWERDWDRVAITEKHNAMQSGVANSYKSRFGDDVLVFKRTMPDACQHCKRLHNDPDGFPRIFRLNELEANGTNVGKKVAEWKPVVGAIHPNCFPAGTLITTTGGQVPIEDIRPGGHVISHDGSTQKVSHFWAQSIDEELLKVSFDGGSLLTTSEHPMLTTRGWVPASGLKQGDDLIAVTINDASRSALLDLESMDRPSERIESGRFLRVLGLLSRGGVSISAIDFDGHLYVWERQIDIEDIDGVINVRLKPTDHQPIIDHPLVGAPRLTGPILCAGDERFVSVGHTPPSLVSGAYVRFAPLGVAHVLSGGAIALDAVRFFDSVNDGSPRDCYFLHREQMIEVKGDNFARVQRDAFCSHKKILSVKKKTFKGTVFNLSVENTESYIANGIATHNCQCQLVRIPRGYGFDDTGALVPGGENGRLYDDESLNKSLEASNALQRAFEIQTKIDFKGIPITIENKIGTVRKWKDPFGGTGETKMLAAYGYIENTTALDEDELDVYVGPNSDSDLVVIVDQQNPHTGQYDEQKVFLGFGNAQLALDCYYAHIDRDMFSAYTVMALEDFRRWYYEKQGKETGDGIPDEPEVLVKTRLDTSGKINSVVANQYGNSDSKNITGTGSSYEFGAPERFVIPKNPGNYPFDLKQVNDETGQKRRKQRTRKKEDWDFNKPVETKPKEIEHIDSYAIDHEKLSEMAEENRKWIESHHNAIMGYPNTVPEDA